MERDAQPGKLIRSVGFWGLCAVILNGMVGAGIFALPGSVGHYAGGWSPLIVLGVGIALLPVVLVFARLAALFDESGGPILYVDAAFGRTAAFQVGWMQCLSTAASAAANANLLADYMLRFAPAQQANTPLHNAIVLAAMALALAINLGDAARSSAWLKRLSLAKLLPLVLLLLLAAPALTGAGIAPAADWSLSQAVLLAVYAFVGFEGALSVAGEARDPKRDFPRALVAVFLGTACVYALLCWAYLAIAYHGGVIDKAPLASLAVALLGAGGLVLVVLAAALSIFGNITANLLSVSRRLLALEERGTVPRWFGVIRADTGLPRNGVLVAFAAFTLLALSGGFVWLAVLAVAARLLVYLACVAALPVIRGNRCLPMSAATRALITLAAALCLALVSQSEAKAWGALALTVLVGAIVQRVAMQRRLA